MSDTANHDLPQEVDLPSLHNWGDDKWRVKAACKGMNTDVFFPKRGLASGMNSLAIVAKSRLICAGCTVRKECLNFALENRIQHGLYGGISPGDRRSGFLKETDGSMMFSSIVKDLKTLRRAEKGCHYLPFDEELAQILRISIDEVKTMMQSKKDIKVYTN